MYDLMVFVERERGRKAVLAVDGGGLWMWCNFDACSVEIKWR